MASRYAGDYFGISLTGEEENSELLKYFPGLKKVAGSVQVQPKQTEGAVTEGGYKVPAPFAGFKTFDKPKPSR